MAHRNRSLTHRSLHIRDAHDAHIILEAVRLNILPLIKRRLGSSEREQLTTGNVFVWEESEEDGGLLRWTDGRRWSQSRMRGDYLFYEEKVETTQEERDAKAARRARRASDPNAIVPPPTRRKDRPSKPNGLTKQTYSALVNIPGTNQVKKWHVVAYFMGKDYTRLPVIDNYDYLRRIKIPDGIYLSSKTLNSTGSDRFSYYSDEESLENNGGSSTYPSPRCPHIYLESPVLFAPSSLHLSTQSSNSPMSIEERSKLVLPPLDRTTETGDYFSLPRTSSFSSKYTPLTPEDRRALSRFRIGL